MSTGLLPEIGLVTKYGIQTLQLMDRFMRVFDGDTADYNRFKSWLVSQIMRGITKQEEFDLMQGLLAYIQSEEATHERLGAMRYLFGLEFLDETLKSD